MTSSWMRVESTSMTTSRRPRRARPGGGDGDVDAVRDRLCGQLAAQRVGRRRPETSSSTVVTG